MTTEMNRRVFLGVSLSAGMTAHALPSFAWANGIPPSYTALSRLKDAVVPTEMCFAPAGTLPRPGPDALRLDRGIGLGHISLDSLRRSTSAGGHYVFEAAENGSGDLTQGADISHGRLHAAIWRGVPLAVLFRKIRVRDTAEITVKGVDGTVRLPVEKALSDVFLATEMNGQPIDAWHGGPVRLVVPGWNGALWMRGVSAIALSKTDGSRTADRGLAADMHPSRRASQLQALSVNSVIVAPPVGRPMGSSGRNGTLRLTGFAWTGQGHVTAVDVTTDGGRSWQTAALEPAMNDAALHRFTIDLPDRGQPMEIGSRASDSWGAIQPEASSPLLADARRSGRGFNGITLWSVASDGRTRA